MLSPLTLKSRNPARLLLSGERGAVQAAYREALEFSWSSASDYTALAFAVTTSLARVTGICLKDRSGYISKRFFVLFD